MIGVLLRSFIFVNQYIVSVFLIVSISLFLLFLCVSRSKVGFIFCIFLFSFSLGVLRFHLSDVSLPEVFESKVDKSLELKGFIIDESEIKETNQKLTIETEIGDEKTEILLTSSLDENFKYGDEINFKGILKKPVNFITDQGKEFDYVNYLRKDGIFYVMNYPNIEIVSRGNGNKIKSALFLVKEKFLEKINFVIPEPESLLMGGLILGEKSSFSPDLRQSFVDTGTIHIVALSGYNVTIIAEWIMKLFSSFPKNFGIGAGIITVILFVVMTGGSSTAVRAGMMAVLALIARATGRNYDVARALILVAVAMIILNPFVLFYDVSFQLSFIATISVIFLAPKMEKYFLWVTPRFGLRDIISVTTSAYIFVMPFILYNMGNLSLVALPTNILILPFIPITMMFGFFTGIAGLIFNIFAFPFGYVSYLLLHYELAVVNFFSHLSFASFSIPNFPLLITLLIYIYFVYKLFWKDIKRFLVF